MYSHMFINIFTFHNQQYCLKSKDLKNTFIERNVFYLLEKQWKIAICN